jgi:hypothetical protein
MWLTAVLGVAAQLLLHELVDLEVGVLAALRQPVLVLAGLARDEALLEDLRAAGKVGLNND